MVDPPLSVPYCMLFCAARSAALWMGSTVRSTVKNAARFAVYDERIISVKNHQIPPTMRVDVAWEKREVGSRSNYQQYPITNLVSWLVIIEVLVYQYQVLDYTTLIKRIGIGFALSYPSFCSDVTMCGMLF